MDYKIGDKVVHWMHGLGTVVAIEEMNLDGNVQAYYVVEVEVLKLWVPVEEAHGGSIRYPAPANEFHTLFNILREPGRPLSDQQFQRKNELRERMEQRSLEGLCRVIRDLTDRARSHTLNQHDAAVLFRAEEQLLDEWELALGTNRADALRELEALLGRDKESASGGA